MCVPAGEHGAQLTHELPAAGVAVLAVLRQRLGEDVVDGGWELGPQALALGTGLCRWAAMRAASFGASPNGGRPVSTSNAVQASE